MTTIFSRQESQPTSIRALTILVGIFASLPLGYAENTSRGAFAEVRDTTTGVPEVGARCTFTFMPSQTIVGPVISDSEGNAKASGKSTDRWFDVTCADVPGPGMGTKSGIGLNDNGTTVVVVLT